MCGGDRQAMALHDLSRVECRETIPLRRDAVEVLCDARGRETLWLLAGWRH